ncbi:MAG TPA: GNAT family N-acetyltransferase, partial [Streptosporangiaceae bacterium]
MRTAALTDERYRHDRAAVAVRDGELVGIAMSGPPEGVTAAWTRQLYVLYVYASYHGMGAGRALLEAVLDRAGWSSVRSYLRPKYRAEASSWARRRSAMMTRSYKTIPTTADSPYPARLG